MNEYMILRQPYLSEKGIDLKEKHNKVIFEVHPEANKSEIKKAIEKIFKVKVEGVHTLCCRGKTKRRGQHIGRRSDWKKAIITLKEGDTIEYFEGT